jgi:hypothetical protein
MVGAPTTIVDDSERGWDARGAPEAHARLERPFSRHCRMHW